MSKRILYRLLSPALWGNIMCLWYIYRDNTVTMVGSYIYLILTIAVGAAMLKSALNIRRSNNIEAKAKYKEHINQMLPSTAAIAFNILVDTSVIIFAILYGFPGLALAKFVSVVPAYWMILDIRDGEAVVWPDTYDDDNFKDLLRSLYQED